MNEVRFRDGRRLSDTIRPNIGAASWEIRALMTEIDDLRAALKKVGDDYAGSSCQKWCYEQAGLSLETGADHG